jgi:hypothetical protein
MPSELAHLLRLHVEAVWHVHLPPLAAEDVELLPGSAQPWWLLHASMLTDGTAFHFWCPGVPEAERTRLAAEAGTALDRLVASMPVDVPAEVALTQVAPPTLNLAAAERIARRLTPADRALVEAFEQDSASYYLDTPAVAPVFGVVVDGRLLSIAHSSRRTAEACELGVDTAPDARRRGYGLAVTVLWAAAVAAEGPVPLYSARADNTASLALAHAAGYRPFARGISIEK